MAVNSAGAGSKRNGNDGGQPGGGMGFEHFDIGMVSGTLNVHAENMSVYVNVFQTPGTYDVTIRQSQSTPSANGSPQQVPTLQTVQRGNGAQPGPSNFSGGAQSAGHGTNRMAVSQSQSRSKKSKRTESGYLADTESSRVD